MTKIINEQYFSMAQPKMVELRKGFLINGQYYLKENMQPVPFCSVQALNTNITQSYNYLHLNRKISNYRSLEYTCEPVIDSVLYDTEDERVSYVLYNAYTYSTLVKYREENNRCVMLESVILKTSSSVMEIIGLRECSEGIEVVIGGSGFAHNIQIYSKSLILIRTAAYSALGASASYPFDSVSFMDSRFLYISGYGGNRFSYYADALSKAIELPITDVASGSSTNYRNRLYYNNALSNTEESISAVYPVSNAVSGATTIKEINIVTFDKTRNEFLPIEKCRIVAGEGIPATYFNVSVSFSNDVWHKTINGKNYVILYNRPSYGNALASAIILEEKIVPKDLTTEKIYEVVKYQTFPQGQSGQIITYSDESKIRFYGTIRSGTGGTDAFSSVYCYELDEVKLEFVKTFNQDGLIRDFGFDKDRNMYILWSDFSVSRHNEKTVANFNARFESGLYEYQGEDIETNLIISTTNLEGVMLTKEVQLDIKGNAKFKANATKTITISTSDLEEVKVPITITGAGALNIFPKIKA